MKFAAASLCATVAAAASVDHVAERQKMVDEINDMQQSWTAHMPPAFTGKPIGSFRTLLGVKDNNVQLLNDAIAAGQVVVSDAVADVIPEEFDSATNWPECADIISDIRDQSNCGTCWCFGAVEAASDRMCIASKGKLKMPLSAQDVCFNSNFFACGGGQTFTAWRYIQKHGAVTGGQFNTTDYCSAYSLPHCHHHGPKGSDPYPAEGAKGCPSERSARGPHRCDAGAASAHSNYKADKYTFSGLITTYVNEKSIQTAIMTDGPVETAFTVYSDFENYAHGVYYHVKGGVEGGHAVKIVGWGVDADTKMKYWRVQNSWNPFWGEELVSPHNKKGAFRIRRGTDECGIESQAIASASGAVYHKMV